MRQTSVPEPPRLRSASQLTEAHAQAGVEAFFRIMALWGVKNDDARVLLGSPSPRTLYNWKKGTVARLPTDTMRRVSYILGIYKALQILYSRPALADGWVKRENRFFGDQSPLERMLGGDVSDLFVVRQYLDAARGGWA